MGPNLDKTFDLELAAKIKNRVRHEIIAIRTIAGSLDSVKAAELCDSALAEIDEEQFKVVVVGEFSRGKSTFINALLGARVLASGIHPVTTILNCIRYSETPEYHLRYRTGRRTEVSAEEFFKIVAPEEPDIQDPGAIEVWQATLEQFAKIEMAEIGFPADLCRNGVEIIDTPGTNDINPAREQLTYEFIPKADAILFMLSALDAIGESEIEFLTNRILKTDVQRIFFIVNFADLLSTDKDRERVVGYIEKQLRSVVSKPRVYLMSSKGALHARQAKREEFDLQRLEGTGLPLFERDLATFLVEERAPIKLRKPIYRALRACNSLREETFPILAAAQDITHGEIEERIHAAQPEFQRLKHDLKRAIAQFRTGMEDQLPSLRRQLRNGLDQVAEAAISAIQQYSGPLEKSELALAIDRAVAQKETALHDSLNQRFQSAIEAEYSKAEREIKITADTLVSEVFKESAAYKKGLEAFECSADAEDLAAALQAGGGLAGLGVLAIAFHFLIPVALIALPFIGTLFRQLRDVRRKSTLARLENSVRAAYVDRTRDIVKSLDQRWEQLTLELAVQLDKAAAARLRDMESGLQILLRNSSESSQSRAEQRARLSRLTAELKVSESELIRISKWSTRGNSAAASA